jgi:glycosyltransferase involved in cell wall biosynthesis
MVGRFSECASVYDITDDWISLTQSSAVRALTIEQDAFMCAAVDAVIVCSQRLVELKQALAQNLHLIPNGVDCEHYRCVLEGDGPLPEETVPWEHPVLGYTGTIHPDRVDVALLEQLAKQMDTGCIALVGPSHLSETDTVRLEATRRVAFTGAVPYFRVAEYMRAFDVCIAPHVVTEFTESLNPIKLWEYLACGKPIVATPVAGFRDFPQFVRIAGTAAEFLAAAGAALFEPHEESALRRREAQNHSWTQRVDAIVEVFEQAKSVHDKAR